MMKLFFSYVELTLLVWYCF